MQSPHGCVGLMADAAQMGDLVKSFEDVFDKGEFLKPMEGPPMVIKLADDAQATHISRPRPIPFAWLEKVKNKLDDMQSRGVLARVETPTEWCHGLTMVPRGGLRRPLTMCGFEASEQICMSASSSSRLPKGGFGLHLPGSQYFSTFDASMSYFQIALADKSQELTTFATPWGRYKHLLATMGLSCAGDVYNQRCDNASDGLSGLVKVVDDCLIFSKTLQEHVIHVKCFLERCRKHGITLNPKRLFWLNIRLRSRGT